MNMAAETYRYRPDFIVRLGSEDTEPLNVVVEVKGQRDAKDAAKADTMGKVWIPAVNNAAPLWPLAVSRTDRYSL